MNQRIIACVREDFLCVVKQWLPQSMKWEEVIEGHYPTYDAARLRAIELMTKDTEAYVTKPAPSPKGGE